MEKIKIVLVMDKFRNNSYTRDLIPAFINYIRTHHPKAEFELVIHVASRIR